MKNLLILSACLVLASTAAAQIVWTEPTFPTQDDQVTLFYDATQGNGELAAVVPVYIHTGVITSNSTGPNDWQHVVGNWGVADSQVLMTPLGSGLHSYTFGGQTLADFYNLQAGETIESLAMVFRNANGSLEGKTADGSDIFYAVSDGSFSAGFTTPVEASLAINAGANLEVIAQSSAPADLSITVDGNEVASAAGETILSYTFEGFPSGTYIIELQADSDQGSQTATRSITVLPSNSPQANLPAGTQDGINYIDDETVVLRLYAPGKDFIFVVGDFNDWNFDLNYLMQRGEDNATYWIELSGLTPGQEYRFHYHVMPDNMRVADPYSEKVLDYWNDPWIPATTYPNLLPFPVGLTTNDPVSVIQTAQSEFEWTDQDYVKPEKERLVIYELLIRDFLEDRNIATLTDTLDYLDRLGVTAVQLMPFNEFEGNNSWGYNPSFFFAPDKAYGTAEAYKTFINACHERGIAVIQDMALNHSFGQNPQVRMWFNPNAGQFGEPTPDNPYFNQQPTHDFNVGYDYNHQQAVTRAFSKRVLEHWVNEYHIDGYRMDLSKGFTQNNTLGNIGAWNAYDQSRVDILFDYANHVWSADSEAYMILEHFADNSEESALANGGFMLWGNMNHAYSEASMGYSGDFSGASYQNRGWNNPHLVAYAESHDEERVMYKNLNFGNSSGNYNITALNTALARIEMVHCFLLPLPGPKMLWQFGEVGYDYSINYCPDGTISENCRLEPKPVRWDYPEVPARQRLYRVTAALNKLKAEEDAFITNNYNIDFGGSGKRMHLNHPSMDVTIVGNFGVTGFEMVPGFQHTGTWYDYFTGEAFEVNDLNAAQFFEAGEYHLYTDVPLETPEIEVSVIDFNQPQVELKAWPNPFQNELYIDMSDFAGEQVALEVYDLAGRMQAQIFEGNVPQQRSMMQSSALTRLAPGTYLLQVRSASMTKSITLIKTR